MYKLYSDLVDTVREHSSFKGAIKKWTQGLLSLKVIEESAELTQSIAKNMILDLPDKNAICEELADLTIVLTRFYETLSAFDKINVEFHLNRKLERLEKTISTT